MGSRDASLLIGRPLVERLPLLIDQGEADGFVVEQLQPHLLAEAAEAAGHPIRVRYHHGYDHSYYFVATVLPDHFVHHAAALRA